MSIHDHANYENTAGMGELVAVLNGVEFRTRHNDYRLVMASRTSGEDRATEDIPPPPVPPAVLAKTTVEEQVEEMKEYFRVSGAYNFSLNSMHANVHNDTAIYSVRRLFRSAGSHIMKN